MIVTSVPLAGALLALGVANARRSGVCLAASALGLLAAWGQPEAVREIPVPIDSRRPVEATGRVIDEWRRVEYGWQTRVAVRSLRQGCRVVPWQVSLRLLVGGQERPGLGARVRASGYLRRASGLANIPPTEPGIWGLTVKSARLLELRGKRSLVSRGVGQIRSRLEEGLALLPRERGRALLEVLLLGRGDQLIRKDRQTVRRFGVAHLFAVSGLHVAILGAGVYLLLAPTPRAMRIATSLCVVVFYTVLTGGRPSILRAGLMAGVAALSLLAGRPAAGLQSLAVATSLMVAWSPGLVLDTGFQLTASATAGIVWLAPMIASTLPAWLPAGIKRSVAASLAAQFGCGPWIWPRFAMICPVSIPLNVIAVPWMAGLLALSMLWGASALIAPGGLSVTIGTWIDTLAAPLDWLGRVAPSALITWPVSMTFVQAIVSAMLALLSILVRFRGPLRLVLASLALLSFTGPAPMSHVDLTMLDVGQGDAILLRDGRHTALIDGGGWPRADIASRVLLPFFAGQGIRQVDTLIVTHSDTDHCQGVADLATYISTGAVFVSRRGLQSTCSDRLAALPGVDLRTLSSGEFTTVGRWQVRAIHPTDSGRGGGNNDSLVLRVNGLGRSALLTGDIEEGAEAQILRRHPRELLEADILKVAHHGSRTSTSDSFLRAVSPRLALISAGRRNRYGHPSSEVVDRLRRRGVTVLRTDRDGMLRLVFYENGTTRIERFGLATADGLH